MELDPDLMVQPLSVNESSTPLLKAFFEFFLLKNCVKITLPDVKNMVFNLYFAT